MAIIMQNCKIWHASQGRKFPLEIKNTGQFQLTVNEIGLDGLADIEPEPEILHTIYIQIETGKLSEIVSLIKSARYIQDYPKILTLPAEEYKSAAKETTLMPRLIVLDDSIRPQHLKLFLEQIWQLEYYRQVVYRLSHDMRKQKEVYDSLVELARNELQVSRDENEAYLQLQEYERTHREFEHSLMEALDSMEHLKDHEMLDLKDQLGALEQLSEYRDQEMDRTRAALNATEKVLEFSQKENIERDKIINAMDRLRTLTDQELLELIQENNELRGKLGMPTRSI